MAGSVYVLTGGTGTLGTILTKTLLAQGHFVRALARNEQGHLKLIQSIPQEHAPRLSNFVGDVRDKERLERAFAGADYCIHAAAMKVIPLCAYNPADSIKTNVLGCMNVVNACLDNGIKRAVFVSSDKACHPSTLYGAQKLVAEQLWLASNRYCGAAGGIFTVVRYGNVFGSNGSILTTFKNQAERGEVTLTDERCTRFHLKLDHAVELVLQALHKLTPGELLIPKLPSYRLLDIVDVIAPKAKRTVIGLRATEKIHESMISEDESEWSQDMGRDAHFIINPNKHIGKRFDYNSGSNTWFLSKADLEKDYHEWLSARSS